MPTQCSSAAPAMTTSASRASRPWSATMLGVTPRANSSRDRRSAMFSTIWMWTQEWSDMCRRSALTPAACHQALTCRSPSTAVEQRAPGAGCRARARARARPAARPAPARGRSRRRLARPRPGSLAVGLRALAGARGVQHHELALDRARRVAGLALAPASRRRAAPRPMTSVASERSSVSSRSVARGRVLDRRDELDARVEVARHEVGRADQHALLAAALEAVDARVLEEAPEHARRP